MSKHDVHRKSPRQSGVVLITGLIFMVILTLIVLATLRGGTLEERMAANARNQQIALQAAEAVVRDGEVSSFSTSVAPFDPYTPSGFTAACTGGYCSRPATGSTPRWKTPPPVGIDWSASASPLQSLTFASSASNLTSTLVASQPRYIVEVASTPIISPSAPCPTILYRVTGRGVGQDASEVLVQTVYRARPASC
jgi:type IV pilus assembly protein PilX